MGIYQLERGEHQLMPSNERKESMAFVTRTMFLMRIIQKESWCKHENNDCIELLSRENDGEMKKK